MRHLALALLFMGATDSPKFDPRHPERVALHRRRRGVPRGPRRRVLYEVGVTVGEALVVLELSGAATREAVRASYLRLLKVRKPDRDPEGFKALRQAYDLLRDGPPRHLAPLVEEARPQVEDPKQAAREALLGNLERIGRSAGVTVMRINLIDAVHGEFPDDAELTLLLCRELFAAGATEEIKGVLRTFLIGNGTTKEAEPVWRWAVTEAPRLLSTYHLTNAPSSLGPGPLLAVCMHVVSEQREPPGGGAMLRRIITNSSVDDLKASQQLIVDIVLEIAHANFLDLAATLADEVHRCLDTEQTALLAEWATLHEAVPAEAVRAVAWALRRHQRTPLELPYESTSALKKHLEARTPRLLVKLGALLVTPPEEIPPPFALPTRQGISTGEWLTIAAIALGFVAMVVMMLQRTPP